MPKDKRKVNPNPLSSYDPPYTKLDHSVQIEQPEYMTNNAFYKTKEEASKQ